MAGGGYFLQKDYNLGLSIVSGIDLQMNYRWTMPAGHFERGVERCLCQNDPRHTRERDFRLRRPVRKTSARQGSVNPHWRHNLRLTWDTPWTYLSAQWRFIGPTSYDNNSTNPLLQGKEESLGGGNNPPFFYNDNFNARISGWSYLDLTAVWHALGKGLDVRAGVTNLLDKDPPVQFRRPILAAIAVRRILGPPDDYLGRQLFVAFTAKF